jgi:hypothetical protein
LYWFITDLVIFPEAEYWLCTVQSGAGLAVIKVLHSQETLPRERTLGEDENIDMDAEEVNRKMFENSTNETSLESPTKDFQSNPPSPPSPSSFDLLYSLTCQVGRGGFGVVYQGFRREEDVMVSNKTEILLVTTMLTLI